MAAFQIHEDIENCCQVSKRFSKYGDEKKHAAQKKNFMDNKATLQISNKAIRQDIKRLKLSESSFEPKSEDKRLAQKAESTVVEDALFVKIEKENTPIINVKEKDNFPASLLYNDEYRKDIWEHLLQSEEDGPRPKPCYMVKQVDISWNSRSVLVDWLASVAEEYKFSDETFHLSVNYIDRFLSQISVVRNKFQLVGAAAMMLATKMEEYYPVDAKEWSFLTGDTFTPRQVLKMEQLIVKVLRFKMQTPTVHLFIQHLSAEHTMDDKTLHLAMYFSELVLLEGKDYLNHYPSKLAAACIALARYTLSKAKTWPKKLKNVSGYSLKDLSPVVKEQQKTFEDSPLKEQQAIQKKYKSPKYSRVALMKPRVLMMEHFDDVE